MSISQGLLRGAIIRTAGGRLAALAAGVLAVLSLALGLWWRQTPPAAQPDPLLERLAAPFECDPSAQPCTARHGRQQLTLRLDGPLTPLQPFTAAVSLVGVAADAVSIEFRMQGMHMGANRFALKSTGRGTWQGQAVLPVCWTGRRGWIVRVSAAAAERGIRAQFRFAVDS